MSNFIEINPVLPVRDVSKAVDYYTAKLGFVVLFKDADDNPTYAGIKRGHVELHLQWHDATEWQDGVECPMVRIRIDDVESLFQEYSGLNVFHERTAVRDTTWGTREFAFYDPDRNGLTFYRDL